MTAGDGGGDSSISLGGSLLQVLKAGLEGVSDGSHWVCGGGTPAAARAVPVAQLKGCDCRSDSGSTADPTILACVCVDCNPRGSVSTEAHSRVSEIEALADRGAFIWRCTGCAQVQASARQPRQRVCAQCLQDRRREQKRDHARRKRATDLSPRPCAACGTTFTPARSDARCCSGKCRAQLSRDRAFEKWRAEFG